MWAPRPLNPEALHRKPTESFTRVLKEVGLWLGLEVCLGFKILLGCMVDKVATKRVARRVSIRVTQ